MTISLRFRDNGTFRIVQFTDTHWANGGDRDVQTRALMAAVLDEEAPDFVALTGDVISGNNCEYPGASWKQAVEVIEARGIPWAAVFGNHDDEGSVSRKGLMDVQRECELGLSEPGPDDVSGVGNYVLSVRSRNDAGDAASLYFIDSNGYAETGIEGYGWIRRDQIEWYLDTAKRIRGDHPEPLPALAFFHIPIPEYDEVWDQHVCYGHKYEAICCPRINTGFFAAMHEAGDVIGTFVGHDHVNDFDGELHGIRLCYGRQIGVGTYGREGFARGARVIELTEGDRAFASWLRLEDGSRVDSQPRHEPGGRVLSA